MRPHCVERQAQIPTTLKRMFFSYFNVSHCNFSRIFKILVIFCFTKSAHSLVLNSQHSHDNHSDTNVSLNTMQKPSLFYEAAQTLQLSNNTINFLPFLTNEVIIIFLAGSEVLILLHPKLTLLIFPLFESQQNLKESPSQASLQSISLCGWTTGSLGRKSMTNRRTANCCQLL